MLITLEMAFLLAKLHIRYSLLSISIPLVPLIIWGSLVTIKNRLIDYRLHIPRMTWPEKLLATLIILQILFVFLTVMIKPVVGVDAWANYSLRAKVFYIEGTSDVSTIPSSGRGHHNALTQTWVFTCINQWDDLLGKIFFPFYFLALLTIFYSAVERKRNRFAALLGISMLATLPFLAYHATLEYCDLLIAAYLFAGAILMLRWFENPKTGYILLAFAFLLSTPSIKNEAYLHLIVFVTIFVFNIFSNKFAKIPAIRSVRIITIIGMIFVGAYALNKALHLPDIILSSFGTYFSRLLPLILVFGDYMLVRANWNIVWPILFLLIIFNFKIVKQNLSLFSLIILELLAFMFYYFTAINEIFSWLFFLSPAVRNMLQFMPLVVYLIAILLPAKRSLTREQSHK